VVLDVDPVPHVGPVAVQLRPPPRPASALSGRRSEPTDAWCLVQYF
jgi:hypothetical protein